MSLSASEAKNLFKKANEKVKQFSNDSLPPAKYVMRVEKCELTKSKKTDKEMVTMTFVVAEGEMKGRKHWEHARLDIEVAVSFLFQRITALGYDTEGITSMADIQEVCDSITRDEALILAQITVSGSGVKARTNFKIEEILEDDGAEEGVATAPVEEEEEDAEVVEEEVDEDAIPETPAESPEEEGEPVEVGIGTKISFTTNAGKAAKGTIKGADGETGVITVSTPAGKTHKITDEQVTAVGWGDE